mmetsp:Transcript_34696/g.110262  ORF Transcript_34696/g.110262 Transcript_34696/m.110262 type:complete len:272 (+) Transcript_34696:64-879(+)
MQLVVQGRPRSWSSARGKRAIPTGAIVLVRDARWRIRHGRLEIANVLLALHLRPVGRWHLLAPQGLPIQVLVPLVPLQVREFAPPHWQPLARLRIEEAPDQAPGVSLAAGRKVHSVNSINDSLVHLHGVSRLKRRLAGQELPDENAQGPPVQRKGVPALLHHLWRKVTRCPTDRVRLAECELGKAHVCELCMALGVEHDVLRLQVPVDDLESVQMTKRTGHAGGVELCMLGGAVEALPVVQGVELAPKRYLQQEEEVLGAGVRCMETNDER